MFEKIETKSSVPPMQTARPRSFEVPGASRPSAASQLPFWTTLLARSRSCSPTARIQSRRGTRNRRPCVPQRLEPVQRRGRRPSVHDGPDHGNLILARLRALRNNFGAEFNERARSAWPLADVSKHRILEVLERATASCRKHYFKEKVSFELLAQVDPARVETACPHAKALLDRVRAL